MRERTLPLTCTGYSTVSSTSNAGSAVGNGSKASDRSWPRRLHSSSAMCGASGATISTSGSATSSGQPPSLVSALFSSISLAIAVLKRIASMSSRTPAMVRCSVRRSGSSALASSRRTAPVSSSTMLRHSRCRKRYMPIDVAGLPRTRRVQRAHRHLVQAQRVGAVDLVDLVGRDGVLQALAHLAPLAGDGLALVGERIAVALHGERVDVDAPLVEERLGQDVALVEQPVVRLLRRQPAQVEQHLVPEPGVQQVQHGVLDAADVQVDAARVLGALRPHPVLLDRGVDEAVLVRRVQVAQLVPAAAGPLRHDVGVAPVALRAVAQVELDGRPPVQAVERALRVGELVVGVERARREAVGVGQHQRQLVVGQGVRLVVFVVDDRERLAPVALAAEQPVAQLVRGRRPAVVGRHQPVDGGVLAVGDVGDAVELQARRGWS